MRLDRTYADSTFHDEWQKVYRSSLVQHRFDEAVYDFIFRRLHPRGTWLDAGSGSGTHTVRLARYASSVQAVDISPVALRRVAAACASVGVENVKTACSALEDLPPEFIADNVHCRGVLMHIPEWQTALKKLCDSLKPGGYLLLFEGNRNSLEALIVKSVRSIQRRESKLLNTPAGLEFWTETEGKSFLVRMADLRVLTAEMEKHKVKILFKRPVALLDLNRFPGFLRPALTLVNWLWFHLSLPFGSGILIVGQKAV